MVDAPVVLVPFDDLDPRVLHPVAAGVMEVFGLAAEVVGPVESPVEALDGVRGQYRAAAFLPLLKRRFPEARRVVGVTPVDLFEPGLNFVFGLAEKPGRAAVVSVARLVHPDGRRFLARVMKETNHELGHTFGLGHCPEPGCVMRFSNSLAEVDEKGRFFCPRCRQKLEAALQVF